jgi:hypothetical protein
MPPEGWWGQYVIPRFQRMILNGASLAGVKNISEKRWSKRGSISSKGNKAVKS